MSKSLYDAWSNLHQELENLWCAIDKRLALAILWLLWVTVVFVAVVMVVT